MREFKILMKINKQTNTIKSEGGKRINGSSLEKPLFSIITAVRNNKNTIHKTIDSILNQTFKSFEHIIIDGASTDGTVDIIKKFNDHVEYWASEPDESATYALNKGLLLSRGKYIFFVNGDDWLDFSCLELALETLENSTADFVFGNATFYKNDEAVYIRKGEPDYQKYIYYVGCPFIVTTIFRRSCFEKIGMFDVKYKHSPDYDFLLRLHLAGCVGVYNPKLMVHFSLGGNTDKSIIPAAIDVFKCSISHNGSRAIAFFYLSKRLAITYTKLALQKILPTPIYQKLHKISRPKSPTIFINSSSIK